MSDLLDVEFAKGKAEAALTQIDQLKAVEFPYSEPLAALNGLSALYKADLDRLKQIDSQTDLLARQQACAHANVHVAMYHDVLGFILRSTNVRNAFEVYDPLLRMCQKLCGSQAKLILSSEWSFSPFTYPAVFKDLPDLIFIGLPATEAGNALIMPLAGHELGHSVWRAPPKGLPTVKDTIEKKLTQTHVDLFVANWAEFQRLFSVVQPHAELLNNLFLRNIWYQSYKLAQRQVEELFCDQLGLRLFGDGFLYSFLYLLSPHLGERAPHYPALAWRVRALEEGATKYGITIPKNFSSFFSEPNRSLSGRDIFLLKMADAASNSLVGDISDAAADYVSKAGVSVPTDPERDRIAQQFTSLSPVGACTNLGDIINAGWKLRVDQNCWAQFDFSSARKNEVLSDLVFKTIEVMEYELRMSHRA